MLKKIAFLINEVSAFTSLPSHVIKFWKKDINIYLRPGRTSGREGWYRKRDIEIIKRIKYLRYQYIQDRRYDLIVSLLSQGKADETA